MRRCLRSLALAFALTLAASLVLAPPLHAGSHLWKIHEIFSNRAGTVQFIELEECCGAARENFLAGVDLISVATEKVFRFPSHLEGSTARRSLLLGTAAYAELPGAPAPDYILPDGFFAIDGDTIWYGPSRNYDSFRFPPGALPLDGRNSLHVVDWRIDSAVLGAPSPTNYANETGTVELTEGAAAFVRGDCNGDRNITLSDPIFLLEALFSTGRPPSCRDACDADDRGDLDISDAITLLANLFLAHFPLPEPWPECGDDASADAFGCNDFPPCA